MNKLSKDDLKKQASKGLFALILRKFFFQFIQTISTIILARLLFPKDFGDFAVLVFLTEFLALLPSQGFATAIIQTKSKLKKTQASSVFLLVTLLSLIIVLIVWLLAPIIDSFYKGAIEEGVTLVRLISFAIIAINIRAVPAALAERSFKYLKLAKIEVCEMLLTQAVSILLAFAGHGVKSLVIGYLAGKIFAAIFFLISSKFLRFRFSKKAIGQFWPFAINSQIYYLIYSISGAVTPLYVGSVLGTTQVGYLSWAGSIGLIPWSISELVGRVALPVFSKVAQDQEIFQRTLQRTFDFLLMLIFPISFIFFTYALDITVLIYSQKWLPAAGALRLFVILGALQSIISLFTMAHLGLGRVKFVRNISLFSGLLFWILATVLVPTIGFPGLPLAWILGTCVQVLSIWRMKKSVTAQYFRNLLSYFCISAVSVVPLYLIFPANNLIRLIVVIMFSLVIYFVLLMLFQNKHLRFLLQQSLAVLK